jgi:hypothetical protein
MVNQFGIASGDSDGGSAISANFKVSTFVLSGTAGVNVLAGNLACYHISVKKVVGDGPTLMADVSRGTSGAVFTVQNASSNPAPAPGGVKIGVDWVGGHLVISQDGLGYDGLYRAVIVAN